MLFDDILRELVHLPCIGAVAQPETHGDLLLHFGGWQQYENPPNPALLASERGKWSLMVLCPWRLDGPTAVICDWQSVANPEMQAAQAHVVMEGLTVESIELSRPGLDLRIQFSRGHTMNILCHSAGKTDDCWYLLRPDDSSIAATHDFRLVCEPPAADPPAERQ